MMDHPPRSAEARTRAATCIERVKRSSLVTIKMEPLPSFRLAKAADKAGRP